MNFGQDQVQKILLKFRGVKTSGNGWIARCPCHADPMVSLTISVGKGGRVLIECREGCHAESICAAVDLEMSDLIPDSQFKSSLNGKSPSAT